MVARARRENDAPPVPPPTVVLGDLVAAVVVVVVGGATVWRSSSSTGQCKMPSSPAVNASPHAMSLLQPPPALAFPNLVLAAAFAEVCKVKRSYQDFNSQQLNFLDVFLSLW